MPDDVVVSQLAQKTDKLDANYHDLDRRMMSMEIQARNLLWLGGFLAAFFAISTGAGAIYLGKVRDIQTELAEAKRNADALTAQISLGKAHVDLSPQQGLVGRIAVFKLTPPPDPYWKTGYISDIEKLTQFASDYVNLVSNYSDETTEVSYSELIDAVDKVRERAKRLLNGVEDEKSYLWHADQSLGLLRYIIVRLHEDKGAGVLSDHKALTCYHDAFPNWLGYNGMLPRKGADSEQCRRVIHLDK